MAGIQTAIRRSGRHTQDWLNRMAQGSSAFMTSTLTDNSTGAPTPAPWLSATATGFSEWAEVTDANIFLVQTNILAGTFTAQIEGSIDGGKTFYALRPYDLSTEAVFATTTFTVSSMFRYSGPFQFLRVNVSALATGPTEFWLSAIRG